MAVKGHLLVWGLFLLIIKPSLSQEDSLRSALNAVNRRQRDLEDPRYDDYAGEYGYSHDSPDDLAFLTDYNRAELPQTLLDYIENNPYLESGRNRENEIKKRMSTAFRERLEEDKERQLEELARNYLASSDPDPSDYNELIRELWEKYRNYPVLYNRPRVYLGNEHLRQKKYPLLPGWYHAFRKRNKNENNDYYNYVKSDVSDETPNWNNNAAFQRERKYDTYYPIKRFPVTKRSSSYVDSNNKSKRSDKNKAIQTDPKVAKDLNNIFGVINNEKKIAKPKNQSIIEAESTSPKPTPRPNNTKEEIIEGTVNDKPLQVKKKSVNWSDYFGLDRRKKSEGLDNEWLMERYHKSISMATKRNAEYPLQAFKNHDSPDSPEKKAPDSKDLQGDLKITNLDSKLKSMEDELIDDALKYTGAHEGTVDSREIQEVKDRVISRLAAAYNLEKMRRALGEYKLSIAKERERLKQHQKAGEDNEYDLNEEKRVSVARKQAIDEEREKTPESDNNIKCAQGDENCDDQNYKTPSEVLKQASFVECPRVQQACSDAANGKYARIFETACTMQQMCLICSNNSWFAPTRQCNVLFLSKALELCAGKPDCQREARRSVRRLVEVSRALRLEPLGDCELACPDRR